MALADGDLNEALDLFCGKTDEHRFNELQQVVEWDLLDFREEEFGNGLKQVNYQYNVTNQLDETSNYQVTVVNARDIEAMIQHFNKENGLTDTYDPDNYKTKGSCIAATQRVD